PDFVISNSFSVELSTLDWNQVDNNYIHDGIDEFTFQPNVKTNLTVFYSGDKTEEFSVLNLVPDNQFNNSDLFTRVYVYIWDGNDESTVFIYEYLSQPEKLKYKCQGCPCQMHHILIVNLYCKE
ncbi:unnamed protein product, partial [marine sediment metagenome]